MGKFLETVTTQRCDPVGSLSIVEPAAVVADAELMAGHAISSRLGFNPEFFPEMLEVTDE